MIAEQELDLISSQVLIFCFSGRRVISRNHIFSEGYGAQQFNSIQQVFIQY